ncbi:YtxH domain-containing protein [Salinimicrobium xinjiangense]|uniref:YtxH domain-containing protein n=1 Tax=Salinimicrobium xinjiangense TaxID=438596 RepID=UPI00041D05A9|nr:YtxH domain-containing protein [Salinimicrobium xinjiangense]
MAKSGSTFLALLTGAAIGAGLGMLYAPESGEETRKKLGENARRTQDDLNRRYKETSSNLSQKARQAKSDFEQRLEETLSSASYKADEILSSLETKLDELKRQNAKFQKDRNETGTGGNKSNIDESVASKKGKKGTTGSASDNAVA